MLKVSATSTHDQKSLIWNFKVSKYYFLARSEKMPLSWVRNIYNSCNLHLNNVHLYRVYKFDYIMSMRGS